MGILFVDRLAGIGLFVLAGATPAALGLLADMSEAFPTIAARSWASTAFSSPLGQIAGTFIGGFAAEDARSTALVATLVLLGVALLPLEHLRRFEPRFESSAAVTRP